MKKAYVFLADGFEEIEALSPVDVLRRAGVDVTTVGVTGKTVTGSHHVPVVADVDGGIFVLPDDADAVVLPGGGLGTENLKKSGAVAQALAEASRRGILIAAICAAPTVLDKAGLLAGKRVTAFPSVQDSIKNSNVTGGAVEEDGNIVTARSAGVALQFSHALAVRLAGQQKADEVIASLYPEK